MAIVGDDLDQDSPVPLYEQLAALLRADIDAARLTVRLPSEMTLTQRYGVSRGTAHRAVMTWLTPVLCRVSRGKGTFVNPPAERRG